MSTTSSNSQGPKLYVNKPKKAQIKQVKGMEGGGAPASVSSSSSTTTTTMGGGGGGGGGGGFSSKPPEIPKESFARRYKYLWPMLLTVNVAVGAYLFMRTKSKDESKEETATATTPTPTPATATATATTESPAITQPVRMVEPIPEQQQRELFKWVLEEKRKIKPKDPEEKKRLDEEKAILKQFIRAKSIPSIP